MPAATPAEVSMSPSSTKSTSGSSLTAGNSRRNRSACSPVGGGRPAVEQAGGGEHEGAGADRHDPGAARVRGAQRRGHLRVDVPSVSVGPPWMPGTMTVSAVVSRSSPWSGSTWKPAVLRTGPPVGVQTRTR